MTAEDIFRRIVGALSQAGIPYMLTGSFAYSYHGFPRATHDIDLVVAPARDQLEAFMRLLPETEYYVDLETVRQAHKNESMFNITRLLGKYGSNAEFAEGAEKFENRKVSDEAGLPRGTVCLSL